LILPFHFLDCVPFLQEKYRLQLKSWNKTPTNNRAGFIHFGDEARVGVDYVYCSGALKITGGTTVLGMRRRKLR
jgi:hypothetical protein